MQKLNFPNITPHGSDDGSVEPKRYSVDFSINISFHLDYLVINFSTHCRITIYYNIYNEQKIFSCKCSKYK